MITYTEMPGPSQELIDRYEDAKFILERHTANWESQANVAAKNLAEYVTWVYKQAKAPSSADDALYGSLYHGIPNPVCGYSCGEIKIVGDRKSIDTARAALHSHDVYVPAMRERVEDLTRENDVLRASLHRLKSVIERDRSAVAEVIPSVREAIRKREWLRVGRGSYEYNDDRWKDEFGKALDDIMAAVEPLKRIAGDLSDSPMNWSDVQAARKGKV